MDCVVDTNVLLVASAHDLDSPFGESHLLTDERALVFEWLASFRADSSRRLVLDDFFEIYDEYRNKLTDQDYGLQVVHEKMQTFRSVELSWVDPGHASVPEAFRNFDSSDKELLAAALTDPKTIAIVNATDTDWLEIEAELAAAGVTVIHVIENWLRETRSSPA
jgi:hypothetical protein